MIRNASILGLASLLLNVATQRLSPIHPIPLGNLFLFVSGSVYGIIGGTISALISELPRFILHTDSAVLLIKNISLVGLIGFVSKEYPLVPNAIALVLFWMFGMTFIAWGVNELSSSVLILLFGYDLILLALSKMLLMSSSFSAWLTTQLRHIPAALLIPECLFIAFALCGGIVMVLPLKDTHGYEILSDVSGAYGIWVLGILAIIPLMLGTVLTGIIAQEYAAEFQSGLLSNRKMRFSGLALRKRRGNNTLDDEKEFSGPAPQTASAPVESTGELTLAADGTVLFLNSFFRLFASVPSEEGLGINIRDSKMDSNMRDAIVSLADDPSAQLRKTREIRIQEDGSDNSRFFEILCEHGAQRAAQQEEHIFKVRDITERRTVETHLLQAKKVESLGAMVNGIAHSFNDALTAITGQASLAKMSGAPEPIAHSLDQILAASRQAGSLVQQLLDFALDTSHQRRLEDLVELIENRSELIRRSVGDSFDLVVEQAPGALPIECNTNLLMQAITNLILNAMESYESGTGQIVLGIGTEEISPEMSRLQPSVRPGRFARIQVKDFGSGMNPEVLSRAFDPLYTTKKAAGHTGLGLSIVFAVVREHDGFLTAESHQGSGTTVSLYFPMRSGEDPEWKNREERELPKPADGSLDGKRVLVVEDDPSVRAILELLLSTIGCTVSTYGSGLDVLKEIEQIPFDIFLVDLVLPAMSGIELAQKIRRHKGDRSPGVIMSGYAIDPQVQAMGLTILRKPFDLEELRRALLRSLA